MKLALPSLPSIEKVDQLTLFQTPLSTPLLIRVGSPQETTLAMRVEELFSIPAERTVSQRTTFELPGKRRHLGHVVAFRLSGFPTKPLEGIVYLTHVKRDDGPPVTINEAGAFSVRLPESSSESHGEHNAPWSCINGKRCDSCFRNFITPQEDNHQLDSKAI